MFNRVSKILNDINRILVPKGCFGCNAQLSMGERQLCTLCRNQLPLTEYTYNVKNPFDSIFFGRVLIKKANSFLFFSKNGIVKNLIHNLKYKNQEQIGVFLGDWCGQIIKENNELENIDFVFPVPLHKKKQKKRGYNQVSLFADRIAYHINSKYIEDVLIKNKNTKTQTKKDRYFRWKSNQNLYSLNSNYILKNKNVLLVDDVVTTGATLEACAKALENIEGVSIYILTMAIVPKA
ncbi:ComF family protein [Cellulophaga sp. HaHaR_3_176]|uniref:ComF family protein n=1 Tax=Cellulophaga sp. HaHaR_3_176 TaxID=1942464 RepID=UPI001C1F941A|nr:ComF family protein [Cellulophaga sp. HaHaR_3_176]QWX83370.1 ComF family protein [Cellulophaga sp. HaHaR_3_176]